MNGYLLGHLSSLTITQSRLDAQPFAVLPWQGRFIRGAFRAGAQSAALSVARAMDDVAAAILAVSAGHRYPVHPPRRLRYALAG